jgi:hypothetical protein
LSSTTTAILDPAVTAAAVLPFLSTVVGGGAAVVAAEFALLLSSSTIAFGWIHARIAKLVGPSRPSMQSVLRATLGIAYGLFVVASGRRLYRLNMRAGASAAGVAKRSAGAIGRTLVG